MPAVRSTEKQSAELLFKIEIKGAVTYLQSHRLTGRYQKEEEEAHWHTRVSQLQAHTILPNTSQVG